MLRDIFLAHKVEAIVVAIRCTDNTANIAKKLGAKVIFDEDTFISTEMPE